MANILTRLERGFVQLETTFGSIPNTTGTATVAGGDAFRFTNIGMKNEIPLIRRGDKTGSLTAEQGDAGRIFATWSRSGDLVANGTPGTAPDDDVFFNALFGQAGGAESGTGTVTAATTATPIVITDTAHGLSDGDLVTISSVGGMPEANGIWVIANSDTNTYELIGSVGVGTYTSGGSRDSASYKYTLADSLPSLVLWSFRQPAGARQRAIHGAVPFTATFRLGEDGAATWDVGGEGKYALDSDDFAAATLDEKADLTTFPTEPGSPVTNGSLIKGFTGLAAFDGNKVASIRSATIEMDMQRELPKDLFDSGYVDLPEADERLITVAFSLYEQDQTAQQNLYTKAKSKSAMDVILRVGTLAGSTYVWHLKGVQLEVPEHSEERRYIEDYGASRAHGSSLTALDEITMWAV